MTENLRTAFESLRRRYGSHSAAAREIGLSEDHYCALRNGRAPIPIRTAEYIQLKAAEIQCSLRQFRHHAKDNKEEASAT